MHAPLTDRLRLPISVTTSCRSNRTILVAVAGYNGYSP